MNCNNINNESLISCQANNLHIYAQPFNNHSSSNAPILERRGSVDSSMELINKRHTIARTQLNRTMSDSPVYRPIRSVHGLEEHPFVGGGGLTEIIRPSLSQSQSTESLYEEIHLNNKDSVANNQKNEYFKGLTFVIDSVKNIIKRIKEIPSCMFKLLTYIYALMFGFLKK